MVIIILFLVVLEIVPRALIREHVLRYWAPTPLAIIINAISASQQVYHMPAQ